MPGRLHLALVLALAPALAALSGCAAPGMSETSPEVSGAAPAGPQPLTLYLAAETGPSLTTAAPTSDAPQVVADGGSFFRRWGAEDGYLEFIGEPLDRSLHLTGEVTLTAFVRAEGPVLQAGTFPHFIAYLGAEVPGVYAPVYNADGSGDARASLLPGEVAELTVAIALPRDGLLLEKGSRPALLLIAVMTQDEATGDLTYLVNGIDHPSRVELTAEVVPDPPAPDWADAGTTGGLMVGSAYAGRVEGASQRSWRVEVPPGSVRLLASLEVQSAVGFGDLDLAVLTTSGETIARSATPLGREVVLLHPHQLASVQEVVVEVTNYGSAAATFNLGVATFPAAPQPESA